MSATRTPVAADGRLALFADCLVVGVCAAIAAAPLVTAYAALVAACATLRDSVTGGGPAGPRAYVRHLGAVIRRGIVPVLVVPPALAGLLALDALAVASGVPGAAAFTAAVVVSAAAAVVVGLRSAAAWRRGLLWRAVVPSAARRAVGDPGGSALLLMAAVGAAAIVVMVPLTALLMVGPLALAAIAVDGRRPMGRR